jgi:hypothetical protein
MSPELIAPMVAYLATDDAQDITGQIFGVRGKEIILFSQPRPIRSAYNSDGWTVESIASVKEAFKADFTPVQTSAELFNWDPLV